MYFRDINIDLSNALDLGVLLCVDQSVIETCPVDPEGSLETPTGSKSLSHSLSEPQAMTLPQPVRLDPLTPEITPNSLCSLTGQSQVLWFHSLFSDFTKKKPTKTTWYIVFSREKTTLYTAQPFTVFCDFNVWFLLYDIVFCNCLFGTLWDLNMMFSVCSVTSFSF